MKRPYSGRLRQCFVWALLGVSLGSGSLRASAGDLSDLRRRAEAGDVTAQHHLGLRLVAPTEGKTDWVEACVWLTLAEKGGQADRALTELRAQLSADQLELVGRRVAAITGNAAAAPSGDAPAPVPPSPIADVAAAPSKTAGASRPLPEEARRRIQELETDLSRVQAGWNEDRDVLNRRLGETTSQTRLLNDKTQQLVQINQKLYADQAASRARLVELTGQLREKQASAKASEVALAQAERESQVRAGEAEGLRARLAELTEQVHALSTELSAAKAAHAAEIALPATPSIQKKDTDELASAKAEIERLTAALSTEQMSSALAEAATEDRRAFNERLVAQLNQARGEAETLRTKLSVLQQQLSDQGARAQVAELELQRLQPRPKAPGTVPHRQHVVHPGETYTSLAVQYYGSGDRWKEILDANPAGQGTTDALPVGAVLVIP